ncbi:MAG: transposase domain-containing protein [Crocinitomicaceae bacterium]|nr:transposase domain-containing protein [Crocinitomicaceae bacterium]
MFSPTFQGAKTLAVGLPCKLQKINPKAWIEDVFEKIEHTKPSQYHMLFPQNWNK